MISKASLALYGGLGALAPDILLLYSKRWTMPHLEFEIWQYLSVTLLYVGLAAVVATIIPYGQKPTAWKAFAVGVALPALLSAIAAVPRASTAPRGVSAPGSLWDLLSLI